MNKLVMASTNVYASVKRLFNDGHQDPSILDQTLIRLGRQHF